MNAPGSIQPVAGAAPWYTSRGGMLRWLLALSSGVALAVAARGGPAVVTTVLGWLAPVPLLLAIRAAPTATRAFGLGFGAGLTFWTIHIHWMWPLVGVNAANYALGVVVLATVFGTFGPLAWRARNAPIGVRWLVVASAWALAEFARLHLGFMSIPFGMLANSQVDWIAMVQVVSVAGLYGVSFVVIAVGWSIAELADSRFGLSSSRHSKPAIAEVALPLGIAVLAIGWGAERLDESTDVAASRSAHVAYVQAGTFQHSVDRPERRREVLDDYRRLTREAAAEGADLVVWPASSVPGRMPFDTGLVRLIGKTAAMAQVPLLVGSSGQDKSAGVNQRPTANSVFLIDARGEILDQYDKIQLLPFNEYLPLRGRAPWPAWVAASDVDARAGDRRTVFEVAGMRFGVLICWENLFPDGFRSTALQGLDYVVSSTNEAFTRNASAHRQMLAMNRLRAIENGIPVIRVSTTGVSASIDRYGRTVDSLADSSGETLDAIGYRITSVPLGSQPSFYARHGDWFAAASAVFAFGLPAWGAARRRLASAS